MTNLDRRMLYFCNLAYDRGKVGSDVGWTPRDKQIGLLAPPRRVERNPGLHLDTGEIFHRDVAVVGQTAQEIVVAFRGTQPPREGADPNEKYSIFSDWINNINVVGMAPDPIFPGIVHNGFAGAATALMEAADGVLARIKAMRAVAGAPQKIILTGHSKGGAVAVLAAWLLYHQSGIAPNQLEVITFGSARAGDADFVAHYAATTIETRVYESNRDIVPLLPAGGNVAPILVTVAKLFGYAEADGQVGFRRAGRRIPAQKPDLADWVAAYAAPVAGFAYNRRPLIDAVTNAHGIGEHNAYDEIVPQDHGS